MKYKSPSARSSQKYEEGMRRLGYTRWARWVHEQHVSELTEAYEQLKAEWERNK